MVMGEASVNAQPKKGIDSSSFLATKASGGNRKGSAGASQGGECLDMPQCGTVGGGTFSAPTTRCRMPQIQRAANRFSQHQPRMKRKRGSGGTQKASRTRIA